MLEYARLDLLCKVPIAGGLADTLIVQRPNAKAFLGIIDARNVTDQIKQFVSSSCRAMNGTGEALPFDANELDAADAAELAGIATEMASEADNYSLPVDAGDGITAPLVYTLLHPIKLSNDDTITQVSFQARKIGDLSEFLDSRGMTNEYHAFMRAFGQLLGTKLPMNDALVDALDFADFLIIRKHIMGKLAVSRRRWKKTSTG